MLSHDREAKNAFLRWPKRISKSWLRGQPKELSGLVGCRLMSPGASLFKTQPDALYIRISENGDYCDIVAFEACGSIQNFYDKRSRYCASTSSILVKINKHWAEARCLECLKDKQLPVRHLSVCYVIKNEQYDRFRHALCPMGHEYFMPLSSINSYSSQKMQIFLGRMSFEERFYAYTAKANPATVKSSGARD